MDIDRDALERIFWFFRVAYNSMVYFANFQNILFFSKLTFLHKSRHEVNMTPSGPRTEAWNREASRTWTENVEACAIRSPIQTKEKLMPRAHMQEVENSRRYEKQPGGSRSRTGPKRAQAGRPSPFQAWFGAPFDLDALRLFIVPLPRATHQFIRHPPPRSREAWGTLS
jgi:hypothetical protein